MSVLLQGPGLPRLPRLALRDRGGEPGDAAGDQVVDLQKSSHPDGEQRPGERVRVVFKVLQGSGVTVFGPFCVDVSIVRKH